MGELESLVRGYQTVLIVGGQWGDEGKGKVVNSLSEYFDYIVRFQGGANAGHTVVVDNNTYKLHLIPSGIVSGKKCVIARGVALDVEKLINEISILEKRGINVRDNLFVARGACVVMPYHIARDTAREKAGKGIGSTKNGIGPFYDDKDRGMSLSLDDVLRASNDGDILDRWRDICEDNIRKIREFDATYKLEDFDEMSERIMGIASRLEDMGILKRTSRFLDDAMNEGARVLFEGAQGVLLCKEHGTKPYTTSSHACGRNLGEDIGLPGFRPRHIIGVAKAYTTRVGDGPFPTEIFGELADTLRDKGGEFGTTTGRPRRIGPLDALILGYSIRIAGIDQWVITKGDVLVGLDKIPIAYAYMFEDEKHFRFDFSDASKVARCKPEYIEVSGYKEVMNRFGELSGDFLYYIRKIQDLTGIPVRMIGTGAEKKQYIMLD